MSEQPYMQLWIADFVGDTLHLSAEEIGMYLLLLMAMWRQGGTLPDDAVKLARIARAKVTDSVMEYFDRADGLITQKRLMAELGRAREYSMKQSVKASARWLKSLDADNAVAYAAGYAPAVPLDMPTHNHTHKKKEKSNSASARGELLRVLDAEHADAVLDHRRVIKKPLSARAAKMLADHLAACPSPNAAADVMIERGWSAVKPEWLENLARRSGGVSSDFVREMDEDLPL